MVAIGTMKGVLVRAQKKTRALPGAGFLSKILIGYKTRI
jgi:hypothetical protein